MKTRIDSFLLGIGALVSFADVFLAHKGSDPGPWAAAVLGILLLRRATLATPQPLAVVFSGCTLAALLVVGDHELLNLNKPVWIAMIIVAGVVFALWERIERLWKSG